MMHDHLVVAKSAPLHGQAELVGAKNAVLTIMASLILTSGKSVLTNVPASSDTLTMIELLKQLGATIHFDRVRHYLEVDTSSIDNSTVCPSIMNKMRASILVMGPLLARFGKAEVAIPGGCTLGARNIDWHLRGLKKLGVEIEESGNELFASYNACGSYRRARLVLPFQSVGATEQLMMFASMGIGETTIVNAALEPEVLDLVAVLRKMGVTITITPAANIHIKAERWLRPVVHEIVPDRLEAGALLLAAAVTGGSIDIVNADGFALDMFLEKLREMGHEIKVGEDGRGVQLVATDKPQAVSFTTGPYPSFPTDLQPPMMVAQCLADGESTISETIFENRMMLVPQLQKMGATITLDGTVATVAGNQQLHGGTVTSPDIRAACGLVLAGMVAEDETYVTGLQHWYRAYECLEDKLIKLGANISVAHAAPPTTQKTATSSI